MLERLIRSSLTICALTASTAACGRGAEPSPTPSVVPGSPGIEATPSRPPALAPTDVPAYEPTVVPPGETPAPAATGTASSPPADAMAYYLAGPSEQPRLFAVAADGAAFGLQADIYPRTAVSRDGRWVATPGKRLPAQAMMIYDLEVSDSYSVDVAPGFDPYGAAFDPDAARLAFLEVAGPDGDGTDWALALVTLADGSVRRFSATMETENGPLPGAPIGWSGDDLLIDTFVPFTEAGSEGVWAVSLPPDAASAPFGSLGRRRILAGDAYLFSPRLAPDGSRLVYVTRDYDYVPEDYDPVSYDLAVNRLEVLDLGTESTTVLVEISDGGALGGTVGWSRDGAAVVYAGGTYAGDTFASLTLNSVRIGGAPIRIAPLPLPAGGFLVSLDWCVDDVALVVLATNEGVHELHAVDLTSGESSLIVSEVYVDVLGCVDPDDDDRAGSADIGTADTGNADVVHVRAEQTGGPAPGTGPTTWTFHVTIEHPDTGWDDYADGWDVVTPDGSVIKPDPESEFTRTLLHPHVEEQPFTRSQTGIQIPGDVTQVRVRAHDIVDGYGGREVIVDLTVSEGASFEVER